jgi:hypothetical protein
VECSWKVESGGVVMLMNITRGSGGVTQTTGKLYSQSGNGCSARFLLTCFGSTTHICGFPVMRRQMLAFYTFICIALISRRRDCRISRHMNGFIDRGSPGIIMGLVREQLSLIDNSNMLNRSVFSHGKNALLETWSMNLTC